MQQAGGRAYLLVRENPAQARVGLRVLDRHPASETGRPRPRALLAPRLAGDGAGGQATPTLRCGRAAVERRLGPVWRLRANVWANAHVPNTLLPVLGLGSGHSHHNHRGHALDHHHRRCETEGWCASRRRARRTSRTAAEWPGSASQSRNTEHMPPTARVRPDPPLEHGGKSILYPDYQTLDSGKKTKSRGTGGRCEAETSWRYRLQRAAGCPAGGGRARAGGPRGGSMASVGGV